MASRSASSPGSSPRELEAGVRPCPRWKASSHASFSRTRCRPTSPPRRPPDCTRPRRRSASCPTSWRAAGRPGCRHPPPPGGPGDRGLARHHQALRSRRDPRRAARRLPSTPNGPQQTVGPTGYIPIQLQTAYGLATAGGSYNSGISYAGIKGDGLGQTIGIFEEGYNPAFVGTSDPNYGTSALAVFDKTFGLPNPPSLKFFDQNGDPLTPGSPGSGNYGAGDEIALDIEWAHAMAPVANIDVLCTTVDNAGLLRGRPPGDRHPGRPPRRLGGLGQLRVFLDRSVNETSSRTGTRISSSPALAAHPGVSVFVSSGRRRLLRADLPARPRRGGRRSGARACISQRITSGAARPAGADQRGRLQHRRSRACLPAE